LGPPGSGKSDLALRLMSCGFRLVADDRVEVTQGVARPPGAIAGLLEVRGLGIMRMLYVPETSLRLVVRLGREEIRLPAPAREAILDLPLIALDPFAASTPDKIALALDCLSGRAGQVAGAFVA
jgi:HPr kinase/phosphorylase